MWLRKRRFSWLLCDDLCIPLRSAHVLNYGFMKLLWLQGEWETQFWLGFDLLTINPFGCLCRFNLNSTSHERVTTNMKLSKHGSNSSSTKMVVREEQEERKIRNVMLDIQLLSEMYNFRDIFFSLPLCALTSQFIPFAMEAVWYYARETSSESVCVSYSGKLLIQVSGFD